jgi:hypothetical protein
MENKMNSYTDDIKFLDVKFVEFGIQHFSGKEICNGWNIPDNLLYNILPTVRVLNAIREWYGKPIYINSTYRSSAYNKAIGGKPKSLHLDFNAIDFTVGSKKDLKKIFNEIIRLDSMTSVFNFLPKPMGNFGAGYYDGRFIHLDVRSTLRRKSPARWEA